MVVILYGNYYGSAPRLAEINVNRIGWKSLRMVVITVTRGFLVVGRDYRHTRRSVVSWQCWSIDDLYCMWIDILFLTLDCIWGLGWCYTCGVQFGISLVEYSYWHSRPRGRVATASDYVWVKREPLHFPWSLAYWWSLSLETMDIICIHNSHACKLLLSYTVWVGCLLLFG